MTCDSILEELYTIISNRFENPVKGSYVSSLIMDPKGNDKILEKIGEEATEFIIAAKNGERERIVSEAGDLQFHLLVALRAYGISLDDLLNELSSRRK